MNIYEIQQCVICGILFYSYQLIWPGNDKYFYNDNVGQGVLPFIIGCCNDELQTNGFM